MTYRVELRPAAARELRKLPRSARDRIGKVITLLADNPRPPAAKMLVSNDMPRLWRVRTGDYRVVFEIHDDVLLVLVVAVRHRREAYAPRPLAPPRFQSTRAAGSARVRAPEPNARKRHM